MKTEYEIQWYSNKTKKWETSWTTDDEGAVDQLIECDAEYFWKGTPIRVVKVTREVIRRDEGRAKR